MFAALAVFILFGLSCVSAADHNYGDNNALNQNNIINVEKEVGTFTELKNKINTGDQCKLEKNYRFDSSKDNKKEFYEKGVAVNRNNFVVDGQGHTIDGANQVCLLMVYGDNVTFKNINFINGNGKDTAVDCFGYNGTFDNCNFTNNKAALYSGALFMDGGLVSNCNFDNNKGDYGALYATWDDIKISGCNFTNNIANKSAVFISCNAIIDNCGISNNIVSEEAGALYCNGKNINIANCSFYKNSGYDAGAIYVGNGNVNVKNTILKNNYANKKLNNIVLHDKNAVLTADDFSLSSLITASNFKCQISDLQTNKSSLNFKVFITCFDQIVNNTCVYAAFKDKNLTFNVVDGFADINLTDLDTGIYDINIGCLFGGLNFDLSSITMLCKNNGMVTVKNNAGVQVDEGNLENQVHIHSKNPKAIESNLNMLDLGNNENTSGENTSTLIKNHNNSHQVVSNVVQVEKKDPYTKRDLGIFGITSMMESIINLSCNVFIIFL